MVDRPPLRACAGAGPRAVEPHLGFAGVGAKFEELLVITEDDAYWLDEDLPHVRRWQRRQTERTQAVATVPAAA